MAKNPYTRIPGYQLAKPSAAAGWFVVQSSYAPELGIGSRYPWVVTSLKRRQLIYTRSKAEALSIMMQSVDGSSFEKWDYEYQRAGDRRRLAKQSYLFPGGSND